jgi:hypothetical protein
MLSHFELLSPFYDDNTDEGHEFAKQDNSPPSSPSLRLNPKKRPTKNTKGSRSEVTEHHAGKAIGSQWMRHGLGWALAGPSV